MLVTLLAKRHHMKSKAFSIICFIAFYLFVPSRFVRADTHITQASISTDTLTEWTKSGSPYLLDESVTIPIGHTLAVDPGVVIDIATTLPDGSSAPWLSVNGSLSLRGTKAEPIIVRNVGGVSMYKAEVHVVYSHIFTPSGLQIILGTTTIASSTFSGATRAISARGATLNIWGSEMKGNDFGIYSDIYRPGPFLGFDNRSHQDIYLSGLAMGGEGNAFGEDPLQNHITIHNSVITDNTQYDVYNATPNTIDATNNWWGSNSRIPHVFGPVDTDPVLSKNPFEISRVCCSSVLFLPGMEASRLYRQLPNPLPNLFTTPSRKIWEPLTNADPQQLYLDTKGKSIDANIFVGGIIDNFLSVGIYKGFIDSMDQLAQHKFIHEWKAFPYDWRFDASSTVMESTKYATSTRMLVATFLTMASSSDTGKVTIIAHSNGGLVAKVLVKKLSELGYGNLVDKVILVAVPERGTPKAVGAMLHGHDQNILNGLLLSTAVARKLSNNMTAAYDLLPSSHYFSSLPSLPFTDSDIFTPILSFTSSTLAQIDFSAYGKHVNTYDGLKDFLLGSKDKRTKPAFEDSKSPELLHKNLLTIAEGIHSTIDSFVFPSSTQVMSLIGWGNKTVKGLVYSDHLKCTADSLFIKNKCSVQLTYDAISSAWGDGTVLASSAYDPQASNYYFDLSSYNKAQSAEESHASILNVDPTVDLITSATVSNSLSNLPLPKYISNKPPTKADFHDNDIYVTVHSPVELHVYDSQGRHTGLLPNTDPNTSDIIRYETKVPGTSYFANTDVPYVKVPYGAPYTITLVGTGTGTYTLDVEHDMNGGIVSTEHYVDMPVTPLLKAQIVISTSTDPLGQTGEGGDTGSSSTPQYISHLLIDSDGDGTIDATSSPHTVADPYLYLGSMRTIIVSLRLGVFKQKILLDKIAKVASDLKKGKQLKADEGARDAIKDIKNEHWVFKNLDNDKKQALTNIFESILAAIK